MNENTEPDVVVPETEAPAGAPQEPVAETDGVAGSFTGKIDGLFATVLGFVENHPWEQWLAVANRFLDKFLPVLVAVAGVLAFATGLVTAIRYDARFSDVLSNFGILFGALFTMHLAPKALALPRSFLENREPDAMRPELLYILKVLLGLGGFVVAIGLLLKFNQEELKAGAVVAVVAAILIVAFSHPEMVGAKKGYPGNVVEETIGIVLFPVKLVISLLTLVVGVVTVVLIVQGVVQLFDSGYRGVGTLSEAALAPLAIPLAAYVLYLGVVFVLDFYRAIVSLPRKFDALHDAVESK
jgi:hypothetical protein